MEKLCGPVAFNASALYLNEDYTVTMAILKEKLQSLFARIAVLENLDRAIDVCQEAQDQVKRLTEAGPSPDDLGVSYTAKMDVLVKDLIEKIKLLNQYRESFQDAAHKRD